MGGDTCHARAGAWRPSQWLCSRGRLPWEWCACCWRLGTLSLGVTHSICPPLSPYCASECWPFLPRRPAGSHGLSLPIRTACPLTGTPVTLLYTAPSPACCLGAASIQVGAPEVWILPASGDSVTQHSCWSPIPHPFLRVHQLYLREAASGATALLDHPTPRQCGL